MPAQEYRKDKPQTAASPLGPDDAEHALPSDTSANTPEAAEPSSLAVNTTEATEAQQRQADVTINQDPALSDTQVGPEATQRATHTGGQHRSADASSTPGDDYDDEDSWGYRDLQAEAKSRDLSGSGTREEIVARLREHDAQQQSSSGDTQQQQQQSTGTQSADTSSVLAGEGEGATANAGTETTTAEPPDESQTPSGDPGDQYPEHGSIGLDTTGTGQRHASILQGLSDERRSQQLEAARQSQQGQPQEQAEA